MQEIQKKILELAKLKSEALMKNDYRLLSKLIHEDFRYINSHGEESRKLEYISQFSSNSNMMWKSQDYINPSISLIENIAILESEIHDIFSYNSHEYHGTFKTLMIFRKEDEHWKWWRGMTVEIQ